MKFKLFFTVALVAIVALAATPNLSYAFDYDVRVETAIGDPISGASVTIFLEGVGEFERTTNGLGIARVTDPADVAWEAELNDNSACTYVGPENPQNANGPGDLITFQGFVP